MSEIVIYQDSNNQIELNVQLEGETVWLTQAQMVALFESSKTNISEHITNILASGELDEDPNVRKFRTVRQEVKREVQRNVNRIKPIIAI